MKHKWRGSLRKSNLSSAAWAHLLGMSLLVATTSVSAQTADISGSLGNFDVVNNTGEDTHGFEVQLEGLTENDVYYRFSAERYGAPVVVPYVGGVYVRWTSPYDSASATFTQRTVPHAPNTPFAGTCYQWYPATYQNSGCEHFGVSLRANPTRTTSRWLVASTDTPGALIPLDPPMPIAAPTYLILPPAQVGAPPAVEVEIDAPEPAEAPELYGDAQWMKVFVVQVPREVTLDELVADNAIVPQDLSQIEVDWDVIQAEPASNSNGNQRRSRKRNSGTLKPTTRSVVRRIEMYNYEGAYDPITHEALCTDPACVVPADGEVGDFISAQMTAVLVQQHSITVTKTGNGNVESTDKLISCGSKCFASYNRGTAVTLTAKAGSGSTFSGWTGVCAGAGTSCTVSVVNALEVNALFTTTTTGGGGGGGGTSATPILSVKANGGKGTITSSSGSIDCGKVCSAATPVGTTVTLTAVPSAGFRFVNWSGGCIGAQQSCSLNVTGTTSVQANFTK